MAVGIIGHVPIDLGHNLMEVESGQTGLGQAQFPLGRGIGPAQFQFVIQQQNRFADTVSGGPHEMTLMVADERPFDTERAGYDQCQRMRMGGSGTAR